MNNDQLQKEIAELKREKLGKLQEIEKHQRENKIFYFKPPPPGWKPDKTKKCLYHNPAQIKLFNAWKNQNYKKFPFLAGNRSGKSVGGVCIAIATMFGYYPWDEFQEELNEVPAKVILVGQQWLEQVKKVLVPKLEEWWPKSEPVNKSRRDGVDAYWKMPRTGSELFLMSAFQDRRSFESFDADLIIWDEPPEREKWVAAKRGLIDSNGRELFVMTLLSEGWIDRDIAKARNPDGTPDRTVYTLKATIYNNEGYGITTAGILEYEKGLTPEEREARLNGVPSYLLGLIWQAFKREIHLKPRFRKGIPIDWLVDIAIDVHPKEKQAVLFVATSPQGHKYVIEEIWEHGGGKWLGQEIIKSIKRNCYRVNRIIIDPAAKGDQNAPEGSTYDQIDRVLGQYGFVLDIGSKDLKSGILVVKDWLITENEEPGVFFFDDLVRTIWEIEGWMWDSKTGKPIDKNDHMCENLRRALQLETVWYAPDDNDEDDDESVDKTANPVTGY